MRAPPEVRSRGRIDPDLYARHRLGLVKRFLELRASGRTRAYACAQVQVGPQTVWRWVEAYRTQGEAGLRPRYKASPGAKPFWAMVSPALLAKVQERVSKEALATWGKYVSRRAAARARKSAMRRAAIRAWLLMARNPKLPPIVRVSLLRGVVSRSLIKAVL